MVDYRSIVKNCKFILSNLDVFSNDLFYEFNATINYFVDRVIEAKFYRKYKS